MFQNMSLSGINVVRFQPTRFDVCTVISKKLCMSLQLHDILDKLLESKS